MSTNTDILDLIGNTPLIKLSRITDMALYAKGEFLNPGGSIKDRVAKHIIFSAEKSGELKPGLLIVEATSGNTGIGIALVAIQRGHPVKIVMPENMSEERKKIIKALGAELILTSAEGSVDEQPGQVLGHARPTRDTMKTGGYIPGVDHVVPPE